LQRLIHSTKLKERFAQHIKAVFEGEFPQVVRSLPTGYRKAIAAMVSRQPQRSFFDPEMLDLLGEAVGAWPGPGAPEASQDSAVQAHLTPRERLILVEIVKGLSSKEIARALEISPRTVEFHRANLLKKFGAKNTAELVRKVLS